MKAYFTVKGYKTGVGAFAHVVVADTAAGAMRVARAVFDVKDHEVSFVVHTPDAVFKEVV